MKSPPSLDSDSSNLHSHRFSAPLPAPNPSDSSLAPPPPLPPLFPSASRPHRPTSLPLQHQSTRNHPAYQSRTASFHYDPNKLNFDANGLPPPIPLRNSAMNRDSVLSSAPSSNKSLEPSRRAYFIPAVSIIQGIVLLIAFIVNWSIFGSPIQVSPFNWMIGPSFDVLIQMGANYVPCMRPSSIFNPSPNSSVVLCSLPSATPSTQFPGQRICTFNDLCGPLAIHKNVPDQGYRVLIAVFLHSGLLHYFMNMLAQVLTLGAIEKVWGAVRMALVYLISGTYGFFLSGAFAKEQTESVGASGAIFGCIGCFLVDLIFHWKKIHRPMFQIFKFTLVMLLSFALGLFPIFDNFAHIGGFAMGTLVALVVMPFLKPERTVYRGRLSDTKFDAVFLVPLVTRMVACTLAVLLYIYTVQAFYTPGLAQSQCPWCKYLSCLPVFPQCQ